MVCAVITSFVTHIVLPVILGVVSSFSVALFVESEKRPRLKMRAEDRQDVRYDPPPVRPARTASFVRVVVTNEKLPWYLGLMTRESAMDCRAEIIFSLADGTEFSSGPMPGRWANTPQPVPLEGKLGDIQFQMWDPNVWHVAGLGISIPPGESESLDIAARFDDEPEAFGWNNSSYLPPLWRNPAWKLPRGSYKVNVTVRSAGQKWTNEFELNHEIDRQSLQLKIIARSR